MSYHHCSDGKFAAWIRKVTLAAAKNEIRQKMSLSVASGEIFRNASGHDTQRTASTTTYTPLGVTSRVPLERADALKGTIKQ